MMSSAHGRDSIELESTYRDDSFMLSKDAFKRQ